MNRQEIAEMRTRVGTDIDSLFGMVDENNDGMIEKAELRTKMEEGFEPLPPGMAEGMDKEAQLNKFFEIADANSDGKISKPELVAFFMKMLDTMEAQCSD